MSRRTAIPASLAVLAALLLMPAAASAAPSSVELSTFLDVVAGEGDSTPHLIDVSFTGGVYVVTDSAGAVAGAGCTQVSSTSVSASRVA